MGLCSLMERITRAKVKDCFKDEEGTVYFVVGKGEFGKAVGKAGSSIKNVQQELGRKVKVIEYSDSVTEFIRNIIYPLTAAEIVEDNGLISIKEPYKKAKSLLIGRGGKNIKLINRAVKRFFNYEVKVV